MNPGQANLDSARLGQPVGGSADANPFDLSSAQVAGPADQNPFNLDPPPLAVPGVTNPFDLGSPDLPDLPAAPADRNLFDLGQPPLAVLGITNPFDLSSAHVTDVDTGWDNPHPFNLHLGSAHLDKGFPPLPREDVEMNGFEEGQELQDADDDHPMGDESLTAVPTITINHRPGMAEHRMLWFEYPPGEGSN
ncbi:hypothetical protein A0H81_02839 [Grifola frondosa]|uniref:Uncharacterized protein n=1 Tax=Grifola frondosa TaxID=5627 RepID=A0A1C7MLX5_GRIFR|nr:hypothetical protein A0H81_02839 [Grifola frondosa]